MSAMWRSSLPRVRSRQEGREDVRNLLAFPERQRGPHAHAPIGAQHFEYRSCRAPPVGPAGARNPKPGRAVGSVQIAIRYPPGSSVTVKVSAQQMLTPGEACLDSFDQSVRVIGLHGCLRGPSRQLVQQLIDHRLLVLEEA